MIPPRIRQEKDFCECPVLCLTFKTVFLGLSENLFFNDKSGNLLTRPELNVYVPLFNAFQTKSNLKNAVSHAWVP